MDWANKVVLVTGASSGIGRGLAVELARRGAGVGLLARRTELLTRIVEEIEAAGGHALALACDVTDAGAVRHAADQLSASFGPIDVLIANAGRGAGDQDDFVSPIHLGSFFGVRRLVAALVFSAWARRFVIHVWSRQVATY